jgi:hypothetical protein
MLAKKIARGVSKALFGSGGNSSASQTPLYSLPQLPALRFSEKAIEALNRRGGIPTNEELAQLDTLQKEIAKGAKRAKEYAKHTSKIAKDETAIAKAYEKGRIAAQKSQAAQRVIQSQGWQQSQQIVSAGEEAIAAAGGEL